MPLGAFERVCSLLVRGACLGLLLIGGACAEASPSAAPDASSPDGGEVDGAMACDGEVASSPEAVCITEVRGRAVDGEGAALSGLPVTVCGPVCYAGQTDDSGAFTVPIDRYLLLEEYSLLPHGRPNHTNFYFALPPNASGPIIDAGEVPLLEMPEHGPTVVAATDRAGAPEQTLISGSVMLQVAEGVEVRLDVEDLIYEGGNQFRALALSPEQHSYFVPPELGLVALYALAPFEASFTDAMSGADAVARLAFVNDLGLAAGTRVEVLALGTYLYPEWVKPGAFEVVATATATESDIVLDAGQGIARLTWIGLRIASE